MLKGKTAWNKNGLRFLAVPCAWTCLDIATLTRAMSNHDTFRRDSQKQKDRSHRRTFHSMEQFPDFPDFSSRNLSQFPYFPGCSSTYYMWMESVPDILPCYFQTSEIFSVLPDFLVFLVHGPQRKVHGAWSTYLTPAFGVKGKMFLRERAWGDCLYRYPDWVREFQSNINVLRHENRCSTCV